MEAAAARRPVAAAPLVRPRFLAFIGVLVVIGFVIAWNTNQRYLLDLKGLGEKLRVMRIA